MDKKPIVKKSTKVEAEISKVAVEALYEIQQLAETTEKHLEGTVTPIRESVLKRFPIVFMLLVTFGFTAVVVGIEQILLRYSLLLDNPWAILIIGISILVFTGTLYKKLG